MIRTLALPSVARIALVSGLALALTGLRSKPLHGMATMTAHWHRNSTHPTGTSCGSSVR